MNTMNNADDSIRDEFDSYADVISRTCEKCDVTKDYPMCVHCGGCHQHCGGRVPDTDTQFLLAQGYRWDCERGIAWRKQGTLFVLFQKTCHIVRNVTTLDEALVQLAIDAQQREKWTIMWTPGRCAPHKPHGNVKPDEARFMGRITSSD